MIYIHIYTYIYVPLKFRVKHPHCNFNFINKSEVKSDTLFCQINRLNNNQNYIFQILSFFSFLL